MIRAAFDYVRAGSAAEAISLIGEPSRTATLEAVRRAKARGVTVSFDPNIRMNLWGDRKRAHESIAAMMDQADVAKVSEDELAFLEGEGTPEAAVAFRRKYRLKALLVTLGAKGCWVVNGEGLRHVPAFPAEVVDTTGAGDLFAAGFLHGQAQGYDLNASLKLGAVCAAEIISHVGARPMVDMKALAAKHIG